MSRSRDLGLFIVIVVLFGGAFPALEVGLVTYLDPIVAVLLGSLFLGEPLVATVLVGLLVVFAGFALAEGKGTRRPSGGYRGAAR